MQQIPKQLTSRPNPDNLRAPLIGIAASRKQTPLSAEMKRTLSTKSTQPLTNAKDVVTN